MQVIIRYQDGTERAFPVKMGHNYLAGSFGVHIFDNGDSTMTAEFGNGYVGKEPANGLAYARVILRLPNTMRVSAAPRIGQYVGNPAPGTTGQVEIGFGSGFMQPGAVKILRFTTDGSSWAKGYQRKPKVRKHPLLALPQSLAGQKAAYDALAAKMFSALQTGVPNAGVKLHRLLGDTMPYGDFDAGSPGGDGIDLYPGWQGSSAYALLVHDLTMERHAVQYRDAYTGLPLRAAAQPVYRATGGRNAWTVHTEYVNADFTPKGSTTNPVYDRIDDQHLVRVIAPAKVAAILYGDKQAARSLEMVAADAWMGLDKTPVRAAAQGSGYGRGFAWTLDALVAAQATGADYTEQIGFMVRASNHVQMTNGLWYRAESKDESALGFAPSPWKDLGMPVQFGACQIMEAAFLACALHNAGAVQGAVKAYLNLIEAPQPLKKWVAVSTNGVPASKLGLSYGVVESFWLWPLAGIVGTATDMEKLVPPGAGAVAGANVRASLLDAGNFNASAKALERLEQ